MRGGKKETSREKFKSFILYDTDKVTLPIMWGVYKMQRSVKVLNRMVQISSLSTSSNVKKLLTC